MDPGRSSELALIRSLGRNYEQDMIFLPLKVNSSHEQAEQGTQRREKVGVAFNGCKAQSGESQQELCQALAVSVPYAVPSVPCLP